MVGSTIPKRAFGRFLRGLREHAGVTLLTASVRIDTSKQTILRLEGGQPTKVSTPELESLLDLYEVTAAVRTEALDLWQEVRRQDKAAKLQGTYKGWWHAYADQYLAHFDHYMRLEQRANHLATHQLALLHGLLQTPRYRREIIEATEPGVSEVDMERRLELAARRQKRLADKEFRFEALLSEAALRHRLGDPATMHDQLRHLTEIGCQENVSIRVVPFGVNMRIGVAFQSFTLLEFPHLAINLIEPPVIYVEGTEGALYLEQQSVIARFRQALNGIQQVALSEDDSRDLVSTIAKEYSA
ncbi:helix-turn-helix domain-containing protein [Nocardia sp. CDC160]|uniref:helix-turn-helix domain-containing protein n=1 Tax=Nocardia sp. CDC160 TaxID=3112166 RepID=UPI002DBF67C2|nr:helix-turn-helix transcriptional regulator [Nocardia sp. CDC160]MEC3914420.1 helix-turn-helix transcriptional regulator [Nocardia sp. CDC160]